MSTLKVNNLVEATSGGGTFSVTRAWVNFNHFSPTVRDSLNVSSVSDLTTGELRVNMSNAMSSANYCALGSAADATQSVSGVVYPNDALLNTSTSINCVIESHDGTQADREYVGVSATGDLA